jgi:2-succinyl-5-enolpyruvyl-6-hydroxy-3-cyclohexene-1-carboxylate synthase
VAAFFALGMARALGMPVALVCTSGTAGANFFPAIVEARRACVPLLVLTADRPPEFRDVGAAQTIDQNRLYGNHVKWFVDVALPEATTEMLRYARTLACRATALSSATPAGPVHLNFPFREPLVPTTIEPPPGMSPGESDAWVGRANGEPWARVSDAVPRADAATTERLAALLRGAARPLFVCGPQFDAGLAAPLAMLARTLGAPLLADPLSQLRWGTHDRSVVIERHDAVLRHEPTVAALAPDLVVRFGGLPTSKALLQYLHHHAAATHVVVDAARWPDPTLLAAEMVHADPRSLCTMILDALGTTDPGKTNASTWLADWRCIDTAASRALDAYLAALDELFEGRALAEITALIPGDGTLFVSSSMPVRDLDAFAAGDSRPLRVLANRGANGIDGVISTALGVAATREAAGSRRTERRQPLVLVIGDVAFHHDMNGLLAAKLHALDATIVVLNNDGGGIFSFLPQAAHASHFEQLFGTPHGLDFAPAAQLYGAHYRRADSWQSLREGLATGIGGQGLHIIEMRTDRARNVVLHRKAWESVAAALDAASP